MGKLVAFPLEEGGSLLVEVPEGGESASVTRGLHGGPLAERTTERAQETFEQALDRVRPAAESLIQRVRRGPDAPEEVQIEFGLTLHAEAGAFIAAASTEANFRVTLTWRQGHSSSTVAATASGTAPGPT